jgi:PAS domain S-box-containing protein
MGFDLGSDDKRRNAVEAAIASGTLAATAPIRLIQEHGQQYGILLIKAVPNGSTGPGVVFVALQMGTFAGTLVNPIQSILNLRFADAAGTEAFFDQIPVTTTTPFKVEFNFGNRHYFVETTPSQIYLARHRGWQSWAVLAAGALGTGLIGGLLLLATGHSYRFEQLVSRLRENEAWLRDKEAELASILHRTPFMLIRLDRNLRYRFISNAYLEMTNRRLENVLGKTLGEILSEKDFEAIRPHVDQVLRGNRVEFEREVYYPGVGTRFLHVVYTPEKDERGEVTGWIASMLDITERKRAVEAEKILIRELHHRTNNLLAVIQGIAHRSLTGRTSLDEARRTFEGRLMALAGSYRQLTQSNWTGISLKEIVRSTMEPFTAQTSIDGPDVILRAKDGQNFSLALHELGTNAIKHGALSSAGGQVSIGWTVARDGDDIVLKFRWQERGGLPVSPPLQRGFGTSLLEATFKEVKFDYARDGLACEISVPLDATDHAFSGS